jgi:hypothetical protein
MALAQVRRVAPLQPIPIDLYADLPEVQDLGGAAVVPDDVVRRETFHVLAQIATTVGTDLTDLDRQTPGDPTLQEAAVRLQQALDSRNGTPLVLLLDNSDLTPAIRRVVAQLEQVFFRRLLDVRLRTPVALVAASRSDLLWTLLRPQAHAVVLRPFSAGQTATQLGLTPALGKRLVGITAGLPGAGAALVAAGWPAQAAEATTPAIYKRWVEPTLAQLQPQQQAAAQALALLANPAAADQALFEVRLSEFQQLMQAVSFTRDQYTERQLIHYYNELEALNRYGVDG